jgi:enoyl-CoA hydratase/carnithine racemase
MDTQIITQTDRSGVLTITMNRPEKRNALTNSMYLDMVNALRAAERAEDVGAVVIQGARGAFTAGNDLMDFRAVNADTPMRDTGAGRFIQTLSDLTVPMIAAIDGAAVGVGTTLLLHCDAAFATERSKFSTPFVDLGICVEAGASVLAPLRIGRNATTRLLLLAETFTAQQAAACGLITAVSDEPSAEASSMAQRLAGKPRASVRATKRLMRQAIRDQVDAAIARELDIFGELLTSPETKAMIEMFLASRRS